MTKEIVYEIAKGVIAIAIVVGALASLIIPSIGEVGARIIQSLATLVIGYYFGAQTTPFAGVRQLRLGGKSKKNK